MTTWLFLIVAVIANVSANVSLKLAIKHASRQTSQSLALSFLQQPWAWVGLFAALVLLGSYLLTIRDFGLGVSYAIVTSLAMVLVTLTAAVMLDERLNLRIVTGMTLIVIGILVLASSEIKSAQTP